MTIRLYNTEELAQIMGWSIQTIYQRRYRGASLPKSIEVDGTIRYRAEDVDAWLESHTTNRDTDDAGLTLSN